MFKPESWFPVSGVIILRGTTPIASVPSEVEAAAILDALTSYNKGQEYTWISNLGFGTRRKDEPKTETNPDEALDLIEELLEMGVVYEADIKLAYHKAGDAPSDFREWERKAFKLLEKRGEK